MRDALNNLKAAISKLTGRQKTEAQQAYDDTEHLLNLLEDAVKGAAEYVQAQKNTATEGGVKYSLKKFSDGVRFVDVTTEQSQFDALSDHEKLKQATKVIKNKFAGKVIGIDNKAYVNGHTASEYGHPVKRIEGEVLDAKARASTELDNLLDAGRNFRTEQDGKDGHNHPEAVGDFQYFDTIFKVGKEYYEGVINIEPVKKGLLLKDITKIRNITQDIYSSYGRNPKSIFLRDASMNIVQQNDRGVNTLEDGTFSLKRNDELLKENAKLRQVNAELREQFKRTEFAKVDSKSLERFTKRLLRDYESGADITDTSNALDELYTYLANGRDGDSAVWEDAQEMAYNVATQILEDSSVADDTMYQQYKSLRDWVRTTGISINKMYDHDLGYESINEFRKANFGRLNITKDGMSVLIDLQRPDATQSRTICSI